MGTDNQNNQAINEPTNEPKVVFDESQQKRVNELIQEAMGRAGADHRKAAETAQSELNTLKSQMANTLSELEALKTNPPANNKGGKDDEYKAELERLKQQLASESNQYKQIAEQKSDEAKRATETLYSLKKQVAIQGAASKIQFINVDVVTKLTEDSIKWDEGRSRFVVLNDSGSDRMNAAFEPMSLDEFFAEFASKNPYLVRGDLKSGSGSKESGQTGISGNGKYKVEDVFGPKSVGKLANQLMKDDPQEYRRLRTVAVENGLLKG